MPTLQSIYDKMYRLAHHTLQTPAEIKRLQESSNTHATKLGHILSDMMHHTLSPSETTAIHRIEQLRAELAVSQEPIEVVDFGAGKSNTLIEHEANNGVVTKRTIAEMSKSSRTPIWGRLLYELIKSYKTRVAVELGTCMGISAAYQASAMQLNGHGQMITLEGAPSLAELSRKHLARLGLNQVKVVTGRFQDTLENVLKQHQPIDLMFIDGHHTEEATIRYFQIGLPYLNSNAVVVFDDIAWSDGMKRAWRVVSSHKRVEVAVDLIHLGICAVTQTNHESPAVRAKVVLN